MTEYLTEQEQIQYLKSLARQYIPAILIGLVLAFVLTSSWRAWQNHQNAIRVQASLHYETMLTDEAHNQPDAAAKEAQILMDQYPKTAYASLAAFLLAQQAVTQNHFKEAAAFLETVIKHGHKTGLDTIARLRLARVKIADNDPKAALDLLDNTDPAFAGLTNAVRGDALLRQNKTDAARTAYQLALKQLPESGLLNSLLQMKLNALPATASDKKSQESNS